MEQIFKEISKLESDALTDFATEKYFDEPSDKRGELGNWVNTFGENLLRSNRSELDKITRTYAKQRSDLFRSR
ncbi:MAG: hypothetical protein M3Y50_06925 [Acidobacteriota bacterium]|nr:hypothetical protein [Acidobacteriota bacterium]